MNLQKALSLLATNKPLSYSEFIRLAKEGRGNEASLKRAECTPLYCYLTVETILSGLQLTPSIIDNAFAEDPGIIELEEVSTFIRNNYSPLKARIMLGGRYND